MNIPRITKEQALPIKINLRTEGQPLHGIKIDQRQSRYSYYERGNEYSVEIRDSQNNRGEVIGYKVTTIGATRSTRRVKDFLKIQDAINYANEWIARTVVAGVGKITEQQILQDESKRRYNGYLLDAINKAGGADAYKKREINRERGQAIKDAIYKKDDLTALALWEAGAHVLPQATRNEVEAQIKDRMHLAALRLQTLFDEIDALMREQVAA